VYSLSSEVNFSVNRSASGDIMTKDEIDTCQYALMTGGSAEESDASASRVDLPLLDFFGFSFGTLAIETHHQR